MTARTSPSSSRSARLRRLLILGRSYACARQTCRPDNLKGKKCWNLSDAVGAGATPKIGPSGVTTLHHGRRFKQLVTSGGALTAAGDAYEEEMGVTLETTSFRRDQLPRREGNVEYLKMRKGDDRISRRWDTAKGEWRYSALGKAFYNTRVSQHIVKVPATFTGRRANGTPYSRIGYYPLNDPIRLPMALSVEQRDRRIKEHVRTQYPTNILADFSEETVSIRDADWQILEMVTEPGAAGEPRTDVTERRMMGYPSVSSVPMPESLCSSAFEQHDDKLCCARQIAEVKKRKFEEICDELDLCSATVHGSSDWRERGCSSKMIFELARRHEWGAACFHGDHVIERWPGKSPLVWTIHESHAYFYESAAVLRKLMARKPPTDTIKVRRTITENKTPPVCDWEEFCCVKEGHFWAYEDSMDVIRGTFLAQGRHPKVTLKDAHRIKTLRYTFAKRAADAGHTGACIIHALPENWRDIDTWMTNLECGPYTGQGLAGATYQALVTLIKRKERHYLTGAEKCDLLEQYDHKCALCDSTEKLE